jgi:hypothetical protein
MDTSVVHDFFKVNFRILSKVIEIEAVWFEKKFELQNGKSVYRVTKGMILKIDNAAYEVMACYGNISGSDLWLEIKNIATGESSKLYTNQK